MTKEELRGYNCSTLRAHCTQLSGDVGSKFLLFNKMDKSPVLAIEVDGTGYHAEGSRQAERDEMKNSVLKKCGIPLLRIRTNESGEEKRIVEALREALNRDTVTEGQ